MFKLYHNDIWLGHSAKYPGTVPGEHLQHRKRLEQHAEVDIRQDYHHLNVFLHIVMMRVIAENGENVNFYHHEMYIAQTATPHPVYV